jgi:hypothetical protein
MSEITRELFIDDLFSINPEGDIDTTFQRLIFQIENVRLSNGDPVTYELVKQKYHDYIKLWTYKFGRKEKEGFLSTKDPDSKKKTLYDFLGEKLYEQVFQIPKTNLEREEYLFGKCNRKDMYDKSDEFKRKYKLT